MKFVLGYNHPNWWHLPLNETPKENDPIEFEFQRAISQTLAFFKNLRFFLNFLVKNNTIRLITVLSVINQSLSPQFNLNPAHGPRY